MAREFTDINNDVSTLVTQLDSVRENHASVAALISKETTQQLLGEFGDSLEAAFSSEGALEDWTKINGFISDIIKYYNQAIQYARQQQQYTQKLQSGLDKFYTTLFRVLSNQTERNFLQFNHLYAMNSRILSEASLDDLQKHEATLDKVLENLWNQAIRFMLSTHADVSIDTFFLNLESVLKTIDSKITQEEEIKYTSLKTLIKKYKERVEQFFHPIIHMIETVWNRNVLEDKISLLNDEITSLQRKPTLQMQYHPKNSTVNTDTPPEYDEENGKPSKIIRMLRGPTVDNQINRAKAKRDVLNTALTETNQHIQNFRTSINTASPIPISRLVINVQEVQTKTTNEFQTKFGHNDKILPYLKAAGCLLAGIAAILCTAVTACLIAPVFSSRYRTTVSNTFTKIGHNLMLYTDTQSRIAVSQTQMVDAEKTISLKPNPTQ